MITLRSGRTSVSMEYELDYEELEDFLIFEKDDVLN